MQIRRLVFSLLLTSVVIATVTRAWGNEFTLDFGGLQDHEEVLTYYDGGHGSLGSGPGPNYGITFTPSFLAIAAMPPYGPPRVGLLNGTSAIMNVTEGFFNVLSFYYEAADNSGTVSVWSGLDGTGVELGSITLTQADSWNPTGVFFDGTGMSVVFTGTPDAIMYDQITDRGGVIPEPSSLLLLGTALGGAATVLWRRARAFTLPDAR